MEIQKLTGNEPAMPMINVGFNADTEDIATTNNHASFDSNFKGLTIRQHFAAMCLQGILSNPALYEIFAKSDEDINEAHKFYGIVAVEHADALIAELNKDK